MLCEAMCGLDVELGADGTIARIRGDAVDPFSRGHICPKALAIEDVRLDPDRVRTPLRRARAGFAPVSWREATDEAADRILELQARHGKTAVALYLGNPIVHSYGSALGVAALTAGLSGHSNFSATSVDQLPHQLAAFQMFGNQALLPIADVDRTRFMLVLGANPVVSGGSIMSAPGMADRLQALRERGGKLVVVDPRRTETAELADLHLPIQPGTDALFLLALLHVIVREGLVAPGRLVSWSVGLERLDALVAPFTPDAVTKATRLDAGVLRTLARDFAAAEQAVVYGRLGMCTQATGGTAAWLVNLLNLVTGNLDRAGGAMFTTPAVDLAGLAARGNRRGSYDRFRSRVRGLPESGGELPVAALAEEMETPGPGQIRGFVSVAGNPVLSAPNGTRLERALEGLDFMVSVDLYRNETTRHAHIILPTSFGFERDHFDLFFNALSVRNHAKYSEPIFDPAGDTRSDFDVMCELGTKLAARRGGLAGRAKALGLNALHKLGPKRALDFLLRTGPHRLSLAKLRAAPHGIDLGPLQPRLPGVLATKDGKIQALPEIFVRDLARLEAMLTVPQHEGLVLIGRRLLRSNNSWMHNSERLTKGRPACTLLMHPDDAAERGLTAGAQVQVSSTVGQVTAAVELNNGMRRGVVSLPHGYGHHRDGVELRVARARPGVSINDVVDNAVDPVSGNATLNGMRVEVRPAPDRTVGHP